MISNNLTIIILKMIVMIMTLIIMMKVLHFVKKIFEQKLNCPLPLQCQFQLAFILFVRLVLYVQYFIPYHIQVSYFSTMPLNAI